MGESNPSWSFSQSFVPRFQSFCTDLALRITDARTQLASQNVRVIGEISGDIAKLKKSLLDATGSLPMYDQRQCESRLLGLETDLDSLRSSLVPKTRFAFKRNAIKQPPSSLKELGTRPPSLESPINTSGTSPAGFELSSQSHRYLTSALLPTTSVPLGLSISDLDNCIVNLLPSSTQEGSSVTAMEISALHVRNIRNSMLLLPVVKGSVLLHNVTSSIIVVGCHQFRMHDSKNVDVYISITLDPIIENSTDIRFAPYPVTFLVGSLSGKGVDDSKFIVQDFSHIKATPSPHWSILTSENRLSWPTTIPLDNKELNTIFARTGFGSVYDLDSSSS